MGMNQPGTYPTTKLGGVTYTQSIGGSSPTSYLFYDQSSIYNGTEKFPKLGSKNVGQMTTVEIDGNTYPVSAAVEIQSTEGGSLLPRMTTAQRTATSGGPTGKGFIPVDGMQVFDTDLKAQMLYADDDWVQIATSSSGGVIGPNSSTVSHIALWNNVDGTLLKDSPIFVDTTSGSMTGVGIILGLLATNAAAPTYSFSGAGSDSGMYFDSANDLLSFSNNGARQLVILNAENAVNFAAISGAETNGGAPSATNAVSLGVIGADDDCDLGLGGKGLGNVSLLPTGSGLGTALKFWNNAGTFYNAWRARNALASNLTWTWPTTDVASGVMTSDGAGNFNLVATDPPIYLKTIVTVSAAEFAAMYATPKLLIAGTAGKVIVVQEGGFFFDYQGVAITGGGNCFPQYGANPNGAGTNAISTAITGGSITGLSADTFIGRTGMSSLSLSASSNGAGIYLSNQSTAFVPNGTTIKVTLIYTLIDFS